MKKYFSAGVLVAASALLAFSQWGCATPPATNTNTVSVATPEPTPDKAAIEAELTRIESDWPRMIKEHDGAAVRRIEADDIIIIYPDGNTGTKEQDAKDIESGALTADAWEISEIKVNVLDKDSAVVTLRNTVKNGKAKVASGSVDMSGQYISLDTFARRNGQWQIVATVSVKAPLAAVSPTPKSSPTPTASPAIKATPLPRATPKATPRATPSAKTAPAAKPATTPVKTP
ncbi:MAG: hypothetical protein QOK48_2500 [Blastocatellia bacterium]|jgi:hypothetical protein|nr:hypothetical protein [Blastocatellia bacterium]